MSTTSAGPVAISAAASSTDGMPSPRGRRTHGPRPNVNTSSEANWPHTASTSWGPSPASASAPSAPSSAIDAESCSGRWRDCGVLYTPTMATSWKGCGMPTILSGTAGGGEAVLQGLFAHLAGGVAREGVDVLDLLGHGLAAQALGLEPRTRLDECERGRTVGVAHDGAHPFTGPPVGQADDRHVGHRGVGEQEVLDLLGGDVLAVADDDVLEPSGDAHEPLVVDHAEVAGPEPPVGDGGRVQGRVDVAHHHLWCTRLELTFLASPGQRTVGAHGA